MQIQVAPAAPSAGGAAFHEILIAAGIAAVPVLFFGWVTLRERTGHTTLVGRLADWAAAFSGVPRWLALPVVLGIVSVLSAGLGVWWDVPIHMQNGRDPGPLANPSHYPILLGLLGITHSGVLSMALARDPLPRHTVRIAPGWRVPLGSLIITLAGLIAVTGFPLDDFWHRIFGQDVTEWGPTHVLMIGGAVTFVLGVPVLLAEAAQVSAPLTRGFLGRLLGTGAIAFCGLPFAFLMEFDLGLPQFPAATQFIIFAFLMAWIGISARLWMGPGGALIVLVLYWAAHGVLFLAISALPDVLVARFLLAAPALVLIELVAAALQPKRRDQPFLFAIVSGLLVGSLGMYGEWLWSKHFMPLPQPFPSSSLPLLLTTSTIAGVGGSLMALWLSSRVRIIGSSTPPASHASLPYRGYGLAGLLTFVVLMGVFGVQRGGPEHHAVITYADVTGGRTDCTNATSRCEAAVTARFTDGDPAADATWFYAMGWQGSPRGATNVPEDPQAHVPGVVRVRMLPTGRTGEYRSEHRLPLYGPWKTLLRLHRGTNEMMAIPLYMPDDPAITSARGRLIQVADGDTATLRFEVPLMQRERRDDVPTWAFEAATIAVMALWLTVLLGYGWCYNRAAAPLDARRRKERDTTD